MAPKNKFTRAEMTEAALQVVRRKGVDGLTAKALAEELHISTQPVFTCFGTMEALRTEVFKAAEKLFDERIRAGLEDDKEAPFLGAGAAYIRFAREEPALYRLLLLSPNAAENIEAMEVVKGVSDIICPQFMEHYHITEAEAKRYFRDMWLVAHSLATLAVTGVALEEENVRKIFADFSVGLMYSLKDVPGFVDADFDRDEIFNELIK